MRSTSGIDFPLALPRDRKVGIKETIGYPAALIDADGDGRLDVLLGGPNRIELFRNLGGWKFQRVANSGLRQSGYWQGVAVGDVDGDGRPDLFLSGFGCSALYLNAGGGRFRNMTPTSGLAPAFPSQWRTSAAFADVDRDGRLDLYVAAYVELGKMAGVCNYPGGIATACAPTEFPPQQGSLFRNLGNGRFADMTAAYGLKAASGNGLGVAFGDVDGDGWPDLYLANDERPCDLFLNQNGHRFANRAVESGTAMGADGSPQSGMGVDIADYDDDGRQDVVVSNYIREPTSLYHNDGSDIFTNVTERSNLGPATMATSGWGVKWTDLDNDGRLDLAIANGHPLHRIHELDSAYQFQQRFQLFHNAGEGKLVELPSPGEGLDAPLAGRALCAGDLDNDGKIDLLIGNIEGQPLLLRNVSQASQRWLRVRLSGRGAEGATVTARVGAQTRVRKCSTAGSYLSAGDPRVHFGLAKAKTVDEVRVHWSTNGETTLTNVTTNREILVRSKP